jgi:6-phospho-3-hexuloisomerase
MKIVSNDHIDSIAEQVIAEVAACVCQVSAESLAQAGALMDVAARIFVAGAGRSGLCMRALGMRLMHLGKTVYVVGEITTPSIAATNLLILASGSGRTASLLAIAGQALRHNARILLFTTNATSPMAELADHLVVIPAPSLNMTDGVRGTISAQPLGTLFEQSLFILCDSLILRMMRRSGVCAAQMFERHANLE